MCTVEKENDIKMIQLPIWVDQLCSYVQFLGSYLNGEIFTKSAGDSSCALTRMFLTQPLFAKEKKGIATDIWTTVKNITFLSKIFNATLLTPLNIPDQLKKLCYFSYCSPDYYFKRICFANIVRIHLRLKRLIYILLRSIYWRRIW